MNRFITAASIAILFFASLIACRKQTSAPTPQPPTPVDSPKVAHIPLWKVYKDSLTGFWTWEHYQTYGSATMPTVRLRLADTTFPITSINDSTLLVYGHHVSYSDSVHFQGSGVLLGDTANYIYFYDKAFLSFNAQCLLSFSRHSDSLIFTIKNGGLGGYSADTFYTKVHH